jgi:hypothetical protein
MIIGRTVGWLGHVPHTGKQRNVFGKSVGRGQLWGPGLRWEDNIEMNL